MPSSLLASPRFALAEPGQLLQDARQGLLQRLQHRSRPPATTIPQLRHQKLLQGRLQRHAGMGGHSWISCSS
ncbi:hypothetical protein [Metapseudomonas furukawaii]|uniref:Uncharacterized protein n=1 Tax=Metapseudomonas furukawaii TaxID=1149133 RepID=A0AAD1FIY0_METFU|nr:hypothetical protein [Pseudomonas furukawaii]BAU77428.1 hypothetical protein KF707C_p390 [Pseudomonas furukawaii]